MVKMVDGHKIKQLLDMQKIWEAGQKKAELRLSAIEKERLWFPEKENALMVAYCLVLLLKINCERKHQQLEQNLREILP